MHALETNDLETAQESLRAALDLAPGFTNARCAYGVALAKAGDAPRAAQVLRSGIPRATSPITAAALYATLGDVCVLAGDFFGAEDAFKQAALTPGFEARCASGMARVQARLGRFAEMAQSLKAAASATKP